MLLDHQFPVSVTCQMVARQPGSAGDPGDGGPGPARVQLQDVAGVAVAHLVQPLLLDALGHHVGGPAVINRLMAVDTGTNDHLAPMVSYPGGRR